MESARIVDETGRTGVWKDALMEVLASAGYGVGDPADESAGLTVLLNNTGSPAHESDFRGDLLVLTIPSGAVGELEPGRTEVTGSSRLKARHRLSETDAVSAIAEEIRPLVNLFVH